MAQWTVQQSRETYNIAQWGDGFFDIDAAGQVVVSPHSEAGSWSLADIVKRAQDEGLRLPLLVRFPDVLKARLDKLCTAFSESIAEHDYKGKYTAVYPIKVNQQRLVVEELAAYGVGRMGLEAGSKPELLAVLAQAHAKNSVIVCNGYKDHEYIRLAMIGQKLGHTVYIVIEKMVEVQIAVETAKKMGIRPKLGLRIRLSSGSTGKWKDSVGAKAKFGLSAAQILQALELLKSENMLDCVEMIHFHLGSQIANIRDIYKGMRECARTYAELHALGVNVRLVDVGGGLAVDYDGTHSRSDSSMNYSMREYANNIIYALKDICEEKNLPHPDIITESGRALTAHHAVLVTDVIEVEAACSAKVSAPTKKQGKGSIIHDLYACYQDVASRNLLESYNDATDWMAEVQSRYLLGLVSLTERSQAEKIYGSLCLKIRGLLEPKTSAHRQLFDELSEKLADKVFCNFSLFQSLPDSWAIDQIFPILPISQLQEKPSRRVVLQDITCDSDGRVEQYVDGQGIEQTLPLVPFDPLKPYLLGIFLVGAYQEILGDMHNLFGDTDSVYVSAGAGGEFCLYQHCLGDRVEDTLRYVNFRADELIVSYDEQIAAAPLTDAEKKQFATELRDGLQGYTYLEG